ncbi:MAG: PAS-domain containing protein [Rhodospirillaceae bacterium]|nr:PAS-domain containing protein [Rhodospirillaceae bacterium]
MIAWILLAVAVAAGAGVAAYLSHRLGFAEARAAELAGDLDLLNRRLAALPLALARWRPEGGLVPLTDGAGHPVGALASAETAGQMAAHAAETADGPVHLTAPDGGRTLQLAAVADPVAPGSTLLLATNISALVGRLDHANSQIEALTAALQGLQCRFARLEAMLDTADAPTWLRDGEGRLVAVSSGYARRVDASVDDVLAGQVELLSGPVHDAATALAAAARRAGGPVRESHHTVIGGERRSLMVTETAETDPRLVAAGVATRGVAVDVTATDDARADLERHRAATTEMLETLRSAIAVYGPDQHLTFYNQAYAALWQLDEAWLETRPTLVDVLEVLRERRRLPEYTDFRAFRDEQTRLFQSLIDPVEDLMHLPDGTTLRSVVAPHPLGGLMFVQEDVTSELTLERNYNTLIAVQRESLDNLAEGLAVFGGDGRLQLSNPAYARLWRLDADLLAGRPHVREVLDAAHGLYSHDGTWQEMREGLVGHALDRETTRMRLNRADGTVIDYRTVPLSDGSVLNSYQDVTDSVTIEQALRASNRALETADRLKSEFIANVSYQLRTPLNAILGFAEILTNQYFGSLNERQLGYAASIADASRQLLSLINDILDIATIEAGYMELAVGEVDVPHLLQGVYDLARDWAGAQQLTLEMDCPGDFGSIEGDERRLKQAIYNLVSNAVKFTPEGGRIRLSAVRHDDGVVLAVSDTGVGISAADHERVFGRFERAKAAGRRGGAGLGLSLVKSIIELHGGSVALESVPGRGTTVSCVLPLRVPVSDAAVPAAPVPQASSPALRAVGEASG